MTHDGAAWVQVLAPNSTPADGGAAVEQWTHRALDHVWAQLANVALTPAQRIAALALAEPLIRERAEATLRAGLEQLQRDALSPRTVH